MKLRAKKGEGAVLGARTPGTRLQGSSASPAVTEGPLAAALHKAASTKLVARSINSSESSVATMSTSNCSAISIAKKNPAIAAAIEIAQSLHLPLLATNGVCYATPQDRELCDVFTAIRHHRTLSTAGRLLARNSERHLKSPQEMQQLFADLPEAITNTLELSSRLEFTLNDLGYEFPSYPVPEGETMISFPARARRSLALGISCQRYGRNGFVIRHANRAPAARSNANSNLIEKLNLAGYFLIVWDMVRFCREQNILAQGRGSAANSAVCYSLGITAVDPVGMELLFERFLSEERGEWPDIDLDLPSGDERERVIQYVYQRYGERGAAMTANVITYRNRMAAREMGKALGFDPETLEQNFRRRRHLGIQRRKRRARPPLPRCRTRPQPSSPAQIFRALHRRAGSAAPSRPALRRHGHLPGTTRFRRPSGARLHARSRRRAVGQRRLRRHGHH